MTEASRANTGMGAAASFGYIILILWAIAAYLLHPAKPTMSDAQTAKAALNRQITRADRACDKSVKGYSLDVCQSERAAVVEQNSTYWALASK